jgi:hypothetical protein
MAQPGNIFNIPHFVSSESPEGLRAKMLENNLKAKTEYKYYSIIYDGKRYLAFYYKTTDEVVLIKRKK